MSSLEQQMLEIGKTAKAASATMSIAKTQDKNTALNMAAKAIRNDVDAILSANAIDIKNAHENNISAAFIDRLMLDAERVEAIAKSLEFKLNN